MAADNIGTAYVQIVPAATGISNKMTTAISPGAQAAGTAAGKKITSSIGSQMQKIGGGMMKAGAIATAVSVPIVMGIKKAMDAYKVQNEAESKLTEIYKTRMGVSDAAAKKTMEYASSLQQVGIIGDEVTLSGAQQLATFAKTPGTVNKLLPALDNLIAQQKGVDATAQDATGIANLFGKALNGQTGALTRVGISFDEAQAKILKTGTEEERAAVLAEVVTQNVGNMNEKLAETPSGKIQQAKNAIGDLWEELGAALAPTLADVATTLNKTLVPAVSKFMKMLQNNPIIGKVVVAITGLLAVGGPLLIILGSIVSSVGALLPLIGGISAPIVAIVAAVGAVIAALITAYKTNEQFRASVNNLAKAVIPIFKSMLAAVVPAVKSIISIIVSLVNTIAGALAPVIKTLTPIITKVLSGMAVIFKAKLAIVIAVLKTLANTISTVVIIAAKLFTGLVNTIKSVWAKIGGVLKTGVSTIRKYLNFSSIVNGVRATFNRIVSAVSGPFNKVKNIIGDVVRRVKSVFPISLGKIFSGIKLPHFKISGGKIPWGIGGMGKKPSVDIQWYAKGGVFDSPQVVGVGEAGREAAIPLQGRYMQPFAKAIAGEMAGAGNTYNIGDVTLDVNDLKDIVTLEQLVTIIKRAKALA